MKILKVCVGHKVPDFNPGPDHLMLCPNTLGLPNELVLSDDRFGSKFVGSSLAEYSQLFGLADLLSSGAISADMLFLFQYRKFISPNEGGYQSVASWVKVISRTQGSELFPSRDTLLGYKGNLIVGSLLDLNESISASYAKVHVIEDLVTFSAACSESGMVNDVTIKQLASMRGIIPSPALCYVSVELFINLMNILRAVTNAFMPYYHTRRDGYQMRSTGYLLERLHSVLICQLISDGFISSAGIWNRYVVNPEIA